MNYQSFAIFLSFFSFFILNSSMPETGISVYTTNILTAYSGQNDRDILDKFPTIRCSGVFYKYENFILLEKENNNLIIICESQMIENEGNKNKLVDIVAKKNQKPIESIIAHYRVECAAGFFRDHVLGNNIDCDKFVSLYNRDTDSKKNEFCFLINQFQVIELTQWQNIREKIQIFGIGFLKIAVVVGIAILIDKVYAHFFHN